MVQGGGKVSSIETYNIDLQVKYVSSKTSLILIELI